jgi:hypothetical protein
VGSDRGTKKISGKWGRTCSASQEEPDLLSVSPACVFFFFLSLLLLYVIIVIVIKKGVRMMRVSLSAVAVLSKGRVTGAEEVTKKRNEDESRFLYYPDSCTSPQNALTKFLFSSSAFISLSLSLSLSISGSLLKLRKNKTKR